MMLHGKTNLVLRLTSLIFIVENNELFEEGEHANNHQLVDGL